MNIFVNTGGWVAYFDQSDRFHPIVKSYLQKVLIQAPDHLATSDYVLDETVTYLRYRVSHITALTAFRTLRALAKVNRITIFEIDWDIRDRAGQIMEQFRDQLFSFTDCTSFALCEFHQIRHAITVDRDFIIFGLVIVPEELAQLLR